MGEDSGITRLGTETTRHIQRIFTVDDLEKTEPHHLPKDAKVVGKTRKTIVVRGKEVAGWIVEFLGPGTDGPVRFDPKEDKGIVRY